MRGSVGMKGSRGAASRGKTAPGKSVGSVRSRETGSELGSAAAGEPCSPTRQMGRSEGRSKFCRLRFFGVCTRWTYTEMRVWSTRNSFLDVTESHD